MLSFLSRKCRQRWMILVLAGLALILVGSAVYYWRSCESLSAFVDRDLRKLDDKPHFLAEMFGRILPVEFPSPLKRLNRLLDKRLPKEFQSKQNFFCRYEPWYLWRHPTKAGERYILFQGRPLKMIPDNSGAAIHFLDSNGKHEGHSEFLTGSRIDIVDAAMVDNEIVGERVIEIKTTPCMNGEAIGRQVYGIFENRVALLRVEDVDGKPVANDYVYFQLGPAPPKRTADVWERLLLSTQPAHVLEALTWIGGHHPTDAGLRRGEVGFEKADAVRLVAGVRKRSTVRKKIAELTLSRNEWIREAALLAQEQLKKASRPK